MSPVVGIARTGELLNQALGSSRYLNVAGERGEGDPIAMRREEVSVLQ